MKTIVYVDGFNLYFSRLKHSPHKWLDLHTLFKNIILPVHPHSELARIKYYTADVQTKFASRGAEAQQSQQRYHRALASPHTSPVDIIKGTYTASRDTPMRYQQPPNKTDRLETWKLEEKQTDVNIALDLYRDALKGHCEQIVVCTNDTDIAPALRYIKQDFPEVMIGIVFPRSQHDNHRPLAKDLSNLADWKRSHINDEELAASQFPQRVPTKKKAVDRPDYW